MLQYLEVGALSSNTHENSKTVVDCVFKFIIRFLTRLLFVENSSVCTLPGLFRIDLYCTLLALLHVCYVLDESMAENDVNSTECRNVLLETLRENARFILERSEVPSNQNVSIDVTVYSFYAQMESSILISEINRSSKSISAEQSTSFDHCMMVI